MRILRAALLGTAVVAVGVASVSGGSGGDPRTPPGLPGLPPPFLGTALTGDGGLTAAIDAYGDVVDLRAGPAGAALIDNPADRQAAGTVPAKTGIVPRIAVGESPPLPAWRAEEVTQRYRRDSNVVETVAYIRKARLTTLTAAAGDSLAIELTAASGAKGRALPEISVDVEADLRCVHARHDAVLDLLCRTRGPLPGDGDDAGPGQVLRECHRIVREANAATRRWLAHSTPLGDGASAGGGAHRDEASALAVPVSPVPRRGTRALAPKLASPAPHRRAPAWARAMYRRSLLTIQALTSRATGAVAAGARDGWAYVWPRDAATAALALAASGHRSDAHRVTRFLTRLDLSAAARFTESGAPVPGRPAQGDASGWVGAAAEATGIPPPLALPWRDRADYQESTPGTYLANALSHVDGPKSAPYRGFSARQHRGAVGIGREFGTRRGLVRRAGDPASGLDSAAAWAVRPFAVRPLYRDAETTLLALVRDGTPFGITPGEGWSGGRDPWSAPTAWSAWSLAALATDAEAEARRSERRGPRTNLPAVREGVVPSGRSPHELRRTALTLLADLRRAATPTGDLPERVDLRTGVPTSTTPLLWSSAFTVLALRELWP